MNVLITVQRNRLTWRILASCPVARIPGRKKLNQGKEKIIFLNTDIQILPENLCTSFHLENIEFGSEQPIPVKAKPSLTDLNTNFRKRLLNKEQHSTSLSVPNFYEQPPLTLLHTSEISPAAEFCLWLQILGFRQSSAKRERSIQP